MNILSTVVDRDICISCGACQAACPTGVISMEFREGSFRATINGDGCTDCGLCTKVCPSYKNDLSQYSTENIFSGDSRECYIAYSNNKELRAGGASGGAVTNMITALLSSGLYRKAAVVDFEHFDGRHQAQYTITDSCEDVLAAAKSKYVSVSTNSVLRELQQRPEESMIVVVLPCQIYAIRQFCKLKRIDLSRTLFLGLFCDFTFNYNIFEHYTHTYGKYDAMQFRSKHQYGWPGHTVLRVGSQLKVIDRKVRMSLKPIFKQNRCRHCFDKLNTQADISFGDCYIKGEESFEGKSSVVIRTERGEEAFNAVKDQFTCKPSQMADILVSQSVANLKADYARAYQLKSDMYIGYPFPPSTPVDLAQEKREYTLIRRGALAKNKEDYSSITKMLNRQARLNRLKSIIKRLIGRR